MGKWTAAAKQRAEHVARDEIKAGDLDVIVAALGQLPPGQLKKVLTEEVLAVLEKYGVVIT